MTVFHLGDRVGPYRIEARLSEGDAVQVYKAVSVTDGALVALKTLDADLGDEETLRRFARESKLAQRVEHRNLVTVTDAGSGNGVLYMAMRYVQGETVSSMIAREGPLPFDRLVCVIGEVGAALDALHRQGIMHRDVRSSNVIVDRDGVATLADFGFARGATDTRITELHRPVGTLDYRAPELFVGKPAEPLSDIYSLGCVAYESLVGTPPFGDRRDVVDLGRAHLREFPPDPSTRRSGVPEGLASAVLTALAKEPSRRPPSGAAYAKMLRFGLQPSG